MKMPWRRNSSRAPEPRLDADPFVAGPSGASDRAVHESFPSRMIRLKVRSNDSTGFTQYVANPKPGRRLARAPQASICLGNAVRRPIAQPAFLRLEALHPRDGIGGCHPAPVPRAGNAGDTISAALLAGAGVVLAGRDTRDRHSILSGAPPAGGHRAALHA